MRIQVLVGHLALFRNLPVYGTLLGLLNPVSVFFGDWSNLDRRCISRNYLLFVFLFHIDVEIPLLVAFNNSLQKLVFAAEDPLCRGNG